MKETLARLTLTRRVRVRVRVCVCDDVSLSPGLPESPQKELTFRSIVQHREGGEGRGETKKGPCSKENFSFLSLFHSLSTNIQYPNIELKEASPPPLSPSPLGKGRWSVRKENRRSSAGSLDSQTSQTDRSLGFNATPHTLHLNTLNRPYLSRSGEGGGGDVHVHQKNSDDSSIQAPSVPSINNKDKKSRRYEREGTAFKPN